MKSQLCLGLGILLAAVTSPTAAQRQAAETSSEVQLLVEPTQLVQRLNDKHLRILDVRSAEEYGEGHIPGAVRVDVGEWKTLALAEGGLHDAKSWAAKLGSLGITSQTHVVVYGDRITDTARIWWLLKYVGVENTSLLNGTWQSWKESAHPIETTTVEHAATIFQPSFQADRLVEIDSLKKSLASDELTVVDTRSDEEFSGGRIPGSAHLEWNQLVTEDGRFKSKSQLQELFRQQGILPNETAVCY